MRVGLAALVVGVTAFLVGCGGGERESATQLTILADNPNVGRAVWHLSCAPTGGDVPSPARACATVAAKPTLITNPVPFVCFGGPSSHFEITIVGRLAGRAVRTRTSTCWTPQMELIRRLGLARSFRAHLLPRRTRQVISGTERTFPPGVLRPGDRVICRSRGRSLELGIPLMAGLQPVTWWGGQRPITHVLKVTRHRDGSVSASCRSAD